MQNFNEYSEAGKNGPPGQILNKLDFSEDHEEDDMAKLEGIFKKLVAGGKINKKQLIAKLVQSTSQEEMSSFHEVPSHNATP